MINHGQLLLKSSIIADTVPNSSIAFSSIEYKHLALQYCTITVFQKLLVMPSACHKN